MTESATQIRAPSYGHVKVALCAFCSGLMFGVGLDHSTTGDIDWNNLLASVIWMAMAAGIIFIARSELNRLFTELARRGIVKRKGAVDEAVVWADTGDRVDE